MRISKYILSLLIALAFHLTSFAQSNINTILSRKAETITATDIDALVKNGYLPLSEPTVIATYMMIIAQKTNTRNWTIKRMAEAIRAKIKAQEGIIAKRNNFGKDSVFIRFPNGGRTLIGMGSMSFDKMITKASEGLPQTYPVNYDQYIDNELSANTIAQLVSTYKYPIVAGNVLLFKRDNGLLAKTKTGDIIEISNRIVASKEFAPFLKFME